MIKKALSGFILYDLMGWKPAGKFPVEVDKMIVIIAPHTSMMDFILGWLYFASNGRKANFAIKKEFFFFPLGYLLKAMGSIPVYRGKTTIIDQMVDEFASRKKMILNITPEGTRKLTRNWKKGFHHIAKKADVPVVLGFFDYRNKRLGVMEPPFFEISDNEREDMERIKKLYDIASAKHPEKFTNK